MYNLNTFQINLISLNSRIIRQILNKKTLRKKQYFFLLHPSSFSHINLHLVVSFLVQGSRILSIKSVIDTQAISITRGNRINPQTGRPGHRLISVTYVDVQIRSNSSRIRHAYLGRLERLLEGVA